MKRSGMKPIESVEKHLPQQRKVLLHSLRSQGWEVMWTDDSDASWSLQEKWSIESTRENRGIALSLWFSKNDHIYEEEDEATATPAGQKLGELTPIASVSFRRKQFDKQLILFMEAIHQYRITQPKVSEFEK